MTIYLGQHTNIIPPLDHSSSQKIPQLASDIERDATNYYEEEGRDPTNFPEIPEQSEYPEITPFEELDVLSSSGGEYNPAIDKILDGGTDQVAFYKSFRFIDKKPFAGYWGIFLLHDRVVSLIKDLELDTQQDVATCAKHTLRFLYGHEIYHFKVDAICLQAETLQGSLIYRPYLQHIKGRPMSEWWEEALANYYGLSYLRAPGGRESAPENTVADFFNALVRSSPGAYALGVLPMRFNYQPRQDLIRQLKTYYKLAGHSLSHGYLIESLLANQLKLDGYKTLSKGDPQLSRALQLNKCPVYWVRWRTKSGIYTKFRGSSVPLAEVEKDFVQRYCSGTLIRSTKHAFYKIDNEAVVQMPNPHLKETKGFELKNIVNQAGLTVFEFHERRRQTLRWRRDTPREKALPPLRAEIK
ncbi:MAG: hypothetical protein H7831_14120 [Magnetococcus sp. WYHC-3]